MKAPVHLVRRMILLLVLSVVTSSVVLSADGYFVGNGMKGKRLAVFEPDYKGLGAADEAAMLDLVNIIRMDLHDFAGFVIVDAQNLDKIQQLQAESEDDVYAAGSTLRPGLLQFAEYEAFTTVTKSDGRFSLSLSITDLQTGSVAAEHTVTKIASAGDVADGGVIKLIDSIIPKLGFELSAMGRYVLRGGESTTLTTDERMAYSKQEAENLQQTLEELETELKKIGSSALLDQNSVAVKAQLETDLQITSQKLRMAQQQAARLEEQREKEQKDSLAAAARSAKANEMIASLSDQVEKTAVQVREKEFNTLSVMQQIAIIEKEKKAYIELRDSVEKELAYLHKETEREYNALKKDPDDLSNYAAREINTATGKPFDSARESLRVENQHLREKLDAEEKENADAMKAKTSTRLKEIADDIAAKQKNLKKKQTIDSLTDENLLNVGEWNLDGSRWDAKVVISLNGMFRFTDTVSIDFNELCKAINKKSYSVDDMYGKNGRTPEYLEFLDTVDAFESLFRMGTPFVYLEADFTVTPLDENHPSSYELHPVEYRLYSTKDGKKIHTYTPHVEKSLVSLVPAYDIRTSEQSARYDKRIQDHVNARTMPKADVGIYGFMGIGNNFVSGSGIKIDFPLDCNWYAAAICDLTNNPPLYSATGIQGALGCSYHFPFGRYPGVYAQAGLGFRAYDPSYNPLKTSYPLLIPTVYGVVAPIIGLIQEDHSLVATGSVGVDIPMEQGWYLSLQYTLDYDKYGFSDRYSIGISMPF